MQRRAFAALGLMALLAACSPAKKDEVAPNGQTPIKLATDWRAQAELGGYYQALATGEYKKRGLDVTLIQGGPAVNVPQLLASGAVDVGVGSNSFIIMNLAKENAPVKAVAAFMQKDPQVLIAHPDQGINDIGDMKGRPILLSDASITAFWVWLKAKYGFTDDQVRKYNYSSAPFLADKRVVQQGYATSEPYLIEKEGKIKPAVFLLADSGYVGQPFAVGVQEILGGHVTVQIAKRSELRTFKVMPKRWVVERSLISVMPCTVRRSRADVAASRPSIRSKRRVRWSRNGPAAMASAAPSVNARAPASGDVSSRTASIPIRSPFPKSAA